MMMHLIRQAIGNLRNSVAMGIVSALNDSGQAMVVNLSTGTGVNRADVEVMSPWGFSSSPPADGMIALQVAIGGDPSNVVTLHPSNPSARFGALSVGEAVIYGADGCRVHVRAGVVEIWAPVVKVFGNLKLNGNLTVNGGITATDDIVAGEGSTNISLNNHDHYYNPGTGASTQTSVPVSGT